MIEIPDDFTDFLYWLKDKTETYWSTIPKDSSLKFECEQGIYGAKWRGLSYSEIDSIEKIFEIKFTSEHRAFLHILHAIDRYQNIECEELASSQSFTSNEKQPYFYNWLTDTGIIKEYIQWPFNTILSDVLGQPDVWLKSWGQKPDSNQNKKEVFTKWYRDAPLLLPLTAHTFLVSDSNLEKRPVLSVWGADIIISGWSLKAYLISEFALAIGLLEMKYYEEDNSYYPEFKAGVLEMFKEYFQFKLIHRIPYWEDIISYYNFRPHQ